jgi:two-component system alkaline phosphatase synthesis response regulator PhoP
MYGSKRIEGGLDMGDGADILIIDDDRDLVNSLRIVLESQKYRVRAAANGEEGYRRIEEKEPDLIVLDVMMSTDTEGFDLAYKLKNDARFQNIPIVMVTGFPQKMAEKGPETFQHILGERWPVSQMIEKPVDPEEMLQAIETLMSESGRL